MPVDAIRDAFPSGDLLVVPDARSVGPFGTLLVDEGALAEDEACATVSALLVVELVCIVGNVGWHAPVTGQGGHGEPVGNAEAADLDGRGHGWQDDVLLCGHGCDCM